MSSKFDYSKDFEAKFNAIVNKTKAKMFAVAKNSFQDLIIEASTPVKQGGRMRVDTGFLRSSGQAALNELPIGEAEGRKREPGEVGVLPEYANYNPTSSLQNVLIHMTENDTVYYGWTANYAKYRELYDGFLNAACQNWQNIVDKHIRSSNK